MFDAHCHLQDKNIVGDVGGVMARAKRSGVTKFLCCGISADDWADVARIGAADDGVVCAYGVHPWYAGGVGGNWVAVLQKYLKDDPKAAVGEIGLDNAAAIRNDAEQTGVFTRQLDIAEQYDRPVSIHCRKAWGPMMDILRGRGGLRSGGAIHSYSGPPDLVDELQALGFYISFSGSLLIPGNKRAAESIRRVSPDRLLLETDSPYIRPEPSDLPSVAGKAAEILEKDPLEIAGSTHNNGVRLFESQNIHSPIKP